MANPTDDDILLDILSILVPLVLAAIAIYLVATHSPVDENSSRGKADKPSEEQRMVQAMSGQQDHDSIIRVHADPDKAE